MTTPRIVATRPRQDLLPVLRDLLATADEAVLATAFIDTRGVHLVERELKGLAGRCRLVATTTFGGDRTHAAFGHAADLGVHCRVLNPSRGTFHPKVIVARQGQTVRAMVGSANLTAGLVSNVEAGVVVEGVAAAELRDVVEAWWSDPAAVDWDPTSRSVVDVLEVALWNLIRANVRPGSVITTVADGRPNAVTAVTRAGLWVETDRSRNQGTGPQLVEPWMIELAWAALVADGELTNRRLLNDLRVHRSSFVCALLARLPGVRIASRRPIRLTLDTDVVAGTAASVADLAAEGRAPFTGHPDG